METYSDFVVKNSQELSLLSSASWWTLKEDSEKDGENVWFVKGKCVDNNGNCYSLLLTDLATVYFTSAGTTQIAQEARVNAI